MNPDTVRKYCLSKNKVTESFPFDDVSPVYKVMNKIFCIMNLDSPVSVNLKFDPEDAITAREEYEQVIPGYHMNKKHWNTVYLNGKATDKIIKTWIDNSYNLVINSLPKKMKTNINE